ncbi:MAG: hypothetical protein A2X84_04515 [Desulfuromonadaceae bacterium GWC2_58_13]|nr:MAG: hypothetical protein A2X84_04515 [Desulfuromonadaceae bacterium GWC2_58_13]
MKRLLLGDSRKDLLSTIEAILKHWGYRVLVSSRPEQIRILLVETSPDLLILGAGLLAEPDATLLKATENRVAMGICPLIVLKEEGVSDPVTAPHDSLNVPLDLFSLFELVQRHMERFPRKNLRLTVKLPGMFSCGSKTYLAEVLSVSIQGLMIKTSFRMEKGDPLTVFIPLVGMNKELEFEGRVLYNVHPGPENNYMQGAGIGFINLTPETSQALEEFIKKRFFGDVSSEDSPERVLPEQLVQTRKDA